MYTRWHHVGAFYRKLDWGLFSLILIIPFAGLITLYSAGFNGDYSFKILRWSLLEIKSGPFLRQGAYFLISMPILLLLCSTPLDIIKKAGGVLYCLCVCLLVLVALFGTVVNGSRRWLTLGAWNIQPAEMVKVSVIICMALCLSKLGFRRKGYGILDLCVPVLLLLLPVGLIVQQPDLGTAISVGAGGGIMLLFMGINPRILTIFVLVLCAGVVPMWTKLHDYQKNRIISLFYPDTDPQGTGYHITQSKIAIGSGELFGKGFLQGTQSQLEFLPEHTTDFIFSVLAEEWGFVGCFIILGLYLILFIRLLRLAVRAKDIFSSLLVVGIAGTVFFHVVVNVGMVIGLLPVVGIPLSLFSYGGSSFISTMVLLGIALRVSIESNEGAMFELRSSMKISPKFRMLVYFLGILMCTPLLGLSEVKKPSLLPKDFQPFNKQEFKDAYEKGDPWDMKALVHDIRLGDLSQRSIWAGTERHMEIKQSTNLFLSQQKVGDDAPFTRGAEVSAIVRFEYSRAGGEIYGEEFIDSRYKGGAKVHLLKSRYTNALRLNDGSMLFMVMPIHRRPEKQGAVLLCYRPFYSKIKVKRDGQRKKVVQTFSDRRAFFGSLSYTLTYQLSGRLITGNRLGIGELMVFATPEFISEIIDEDRLKSANPYLELSGGKTDGINRVKYDGVTPVRSDITASVRFEIPGGKSGTYLHHRIVEIIPGNEEIEWVRGLFSSVAVGDLPYEETAECAYYLSYRVEREIYGEANGDSVGVE